MRSISALRWGLTPRLVVLLDAADRVGQLSGVPMRGTAVTKLQKMLEKMGIERTDVYVTVLEKTGDVEKDMAMLRGEMHTLHPSVILCQGPRAFALLTGHGDFTERMGSEESSRAPWPSAVVIASYPISALWAAPEKEMVMEQDVKRVKEHLDGRWQGVDVVERFELAPSSERALRALRTIWKVLEEGPKQISFDIETRAGHIACLGLAANTHSALVVPLMTECDFEGFYTFHEEVEIVWALRHIMTHKNFCGIGQNVKYDCEYIKRHWDFFPRVTFDTMIGHHFIMTAATSLEDEKGSKGVFRKNLGFLSRLYHPRHRYWKDKLHDYADEREFWTYNARDCVNTMAIAFRQQELIAGMSQHRQEAHAHLQSLLAPTMEMTARGIRVDHVAKKQAKKDLEAALGERQAWLNEVLGHEISVKSPLQMKSLLYTDMKLKALTKKTAAGSSVTCDAKALAKIKEEIAGPGGWGLFLEVIDSMRSIGVFLSTFLGYVESPDKRLRCAYNIAGTKTQRFAHTKTAFGEGANLANIPKYEKASGSVFQLPDMRAMFLPDEGWEYFDCDLDSADLRIVQAESRCRVLGEMLDAGLKPYVEIAKEYYHDPSINKAHPSYKTFKALAHGTHYLGKPSALALNTGLLVHEVERIQRWYFGKCPEIKAWHARVKAEIAGRRFIENVFGERLYFPGHITEDSYKEGMAWIPQSTVAGVINRVLVRLWRAHPDRIQLLNQVHDSLNGQFRIVDREWALERIVELGAIELPYEPKPIMIPLGIKSSPISWGACE